MSDNTMTFRMDETISKPEIKQYVEKLYNVKVDKVNTARFMGKVKASMITGKPYMTKNFKKVFVMCDGKIPSILNETMKWFPTNIEILIWLMMRAGISF